VTQTPSHRRPTFQKPPKNLKPPKRSTSCKPPADDAAAMDTDAKPAAAEAKADAEAKEGGANKEKEAAAGEGEAKKEAAQPEPSSYQIENPARVVPAQVPASFHVPAMQAARFLCIIFSVRVLPESLSGWRTPATLQALGGVPQCGLRCSPLRMPGRNARVRLPSTDRFEWCRVAGEIRQPVGGAAVAAGPPGRQERLRRPQGHAPWCALRLHLPATASEWLPVIARLASWICQKC